MRSQLKVSQNAVLAWRRVARIAEPFLFFARPRAAAENLKRIEAWPFVLMLLLALHGSNAIAQSGWTANDVRPLVEDSVRRVSHVTNILVDPRVTDEISESVLLFAS